MTSRDDGEVENSPVRYSAVTNDREGEIRSSDLFMVTRSVIRADVVPFLLILRGLVLLAACADLFLHLLDLVWVGRYLGIAGTILILASFIYSLRKRKLIAFGTPRALLAWHTTSAWLGSLLILVHAGVHFAAWLPWLATAAMTVNVISGVTGKLLLDRARRHLSDRREQLISAGISADVADESLHWDSVAVDVMKRWREVHLPITIAFVTLALGHILSIFLFWGWS